jgi:hypothetical protein
MRRSTSRTRGASSAPIIFSLRALCSLIHVAFSTHAIIIVYHLQVDKMSEVLLMFRGSKNQFLVSDTSLAQDEISSCLYSFSSLS